MAFGLNSTANDNTHHRRAAVLELLLTKESFDQAALARAELVAGRTDQPIEQVLNQLGALSDEDLADAYSEVSGSPRWDPLRLVPLVDFVDLGVSVDFVRRTRMLPL